MILSNDLISKFVKTTKDETKESKDTIVYGTVRKDTGYVKLDGSDIETPIDTTSVVVKEGDRVSVLIKNHTASITGNLAPEGKSARTGDTLSVDKLDVVYAEIDKLVAADVKIQGQLEANNAVIENLDATYVKSEYLESEYITADEIDASYVKTETLESDYIKAEKIDADYAKISELKAATGDISTLKSDVADINTLIFGSATGDVIQTEFSNSVIAQLGDAQIKSAMIESVAASKITAGDIITNNVRVMSEDGSLIISDETLQISDGTRVRVQIGKDADDDYSINIWDQNGTLMFSKGGITDAAIKSAIIRNDMVSETANIHASKLNIDSLFEEIDGSTNTIKSTKITVDDEGQTLEAKLTTLATTESVDGLTKTVTSQGNQISANTEALKSVVWQQDFNTAKNEMTTQFSTLEEKVDGISSTVASHTSTLNDLDSRVTSADSSITQLSNKITANVTETTNLGTRMTTVEQTADSLSVELENLEIGGRNIILKSDFSNKTNTDNFTYNSSERMVTVTSDTLTQTMTSSLKLSDYGKNKLSGSIIVISGEYKIPTTLQYGNTNPYIGIELALIRDSNTGGSSQWMSWLGGTTIGSAATDGWVKYTQVLSPSNYGFSHYNLHFVLRDFVGTVQFRNLKIEFGNKATDWSPAPEDVENDILDAAKTATNYLNFSSSGLIIGDLTSDTLGKNVLIDSDSVDIRNGDATLASFGADYLYLAKNSRNAKIDLCNGLATLYHESKYSYDTMFIIDTGNTTEIMGLITPLCVTSTDDLDNVSIQFANANGVMGGIGIIGSYLRRFGSNMYDNYTILDKGNFDDVMDSGWFYGGAIGDGFSIYADDTQVQYRKIGKIVHIRGVVKPTSDIAGSTTSYTLFTLPEGYRPSVPVYARCQGSSANTWLLSITAAGAVRFSRYGYGSTYVTATAGTWLPFDVTFFID